jgi:hypothetical protein
LLLEDREIPRTLKGLDLNGHRVCDRAERHPIEVDEVGRKREIFSTASDLDAPTTTMSRQPIASDTPAVIGTTVELMMLWCW